MARVTLEFKNEAEARAVAAAMEDPATRAMVLVVGTLLPLSHAARQRVLTFTQSKLSEQDQRTRAEAARKASSARRTATASKAKVAKAPKPKPTKKGAKKGKRREARVR